MSMETPLTANGAAIAPLTDEKIDPSIGHAISHGDVGSSEVGNTSTFLSSETAPVEHSLAAPGTIGSADHALGGEPSTTTTTTIITTTTEIPAHGTSIASPILSEGTAAPLAASAPLGSEVAAAGTGDMLSRDGTTNDTTAVLHPAAVATTDATTTEAPVTSNGAVPAAAAVGAVGGGAGVAALAEKEAQPEKELPPAMSSKDAKKYSKLLKKESKSDEKELAAAIKTAHTDEKLFRKAKKAELQSSKRHRTAIEDEHQTSKALNKAKLSQEKANAALEKAAEELDIKKKHTSATSDAYEKIKKRIESLRSEKIKNDADRARRQASISQRT
ncbi:hypothetical protein CBS101457_006490 [Exobasidium rhododendri]|nr:hypothetical protein CBS101457_006490 [Exobasidium rhododendri]